MSIESWKPPRSYTPIEVAALASDRMQKRADTFKQALISEAMKALAAGETITEVARQAGVSRETIYTWAREGRKEAVPGQGSEDG
jgi:DNA-binding phage protein